MYAIFQNFNKQFIAFKNKILFLEKLNNKINSKIEFNNILLINENNKLLLGNPYLNNRKVIAIVLDHLKSKKISVIKFKRRKHHLKRYNHRQLITKIKIFEII